MQIQPPRFWAVGLTAIAFWAGIFVLAFSSSASADPPSRVARLGYVAGAVSFSPGGENDWVQAALNRPLTTGDRLWTDARARAEVQFGGTVIRMSQHTGVTVLNLDDQIAQLQLTQGTLNVRVRRLGAQQAVEVDTPNLAFTLRQPGEYRIEVDADGNATTIAIRSGRGEVYGENASYAIDSRQTYRFTGTSLREYDYLEAPRRDEFDRWSTDRDRRYDNSSSARYVSPDVVGYEDLDANGSWRTDATYGNVWYPNRVASGWAPYRDGHWAWIDPWGWTWMDDAPWGYAVSHYGRWTNLRGTWGWVPGPVRSRAYYAPALVAFVGGNNFQLTVSSGNVGGVAWFPLAPREVYRPSYAVSRGYFENINRSNTVINTTVINNYYNNSNVTNVVYANQQVPGAVIAVPMAAFAQSQAVSRVAVPLSREVIVSAPVGFVPRVAPTEKSVRGAADQGGKPPGRVFERPAVARSAPPAARAGFAAQQQQLAAKPGNPLDDAARRALKPAAAVPAPVVNVVVPAQVAPPTTPPPRVAPAGKADARGKARDNGIPPAPAAVAPPPMQGASPVPVMPAQRSRGDSRSPPADPAPPVATPAVPAVIAPQALPPSPVMPAPEQRGKADPRSRGDRGDTRTPPPRVAPASSPNAVSPPAPVAPPKAVTPPATPPASAAPEGEPRGKSNQRDRTEQRQQPAAPPSPASRAAEPINTPPQAVPPAPPVPPPRVKPEPAPPAAKPLQVPPPVAAPASQPTPKAAPRDPNGNKNDAKNDAKKDDKKGTKKDSKQDDEEQKPDDEQRKGNNRK